MDDAGLHAGLGPHGLDRLGKAFESVAADEDHVFDAPVTEFGDHPQPELGTLGGLQPDAQHVLAALDVDADGDVCCLVAHGAFVADLAHDGVEIDHRIHRVEWPHLPLLQFVEHGIGDRRDQVRRNLHLIHLGDVGPDVAHRHPPGVHRDHSLVEPRQAARALRHELRFEASVAVPWDRQIDGAELGQHRLGIGPVAGVA
jgi:hypothetical protein